MTNNLKPKIEAYGADKSKEFAHEEAPRNASALLFHRMRNSHKEGFTACLNLLWESVEALEFYGDSKMWTKEDIGSMTRPQTWMEIFRHENKPAQEAIANLDELLNKKETK